MGIVARRLLQVFIQEMMTWTKLVEVNGVQNVWIVDVF